MPPETVVVVQVLGEVPGSPVFLMKLATGARHIEVQVMGDSHGNAVALNGRDCSTQRRHQKIFEEGPPLITPQPAFNQMMKAATELCRSIGYQSAGHCCPGLWAGACNADGGSGGDGDGAGRDCGVLV